MKASDDLFQLIKSLTKPEKRYFKLFSHIQSGGKNYLKLFDAIDKQKNYNEVSIKTLFKKEKFIIQLTRTKGYLYELLLKSLKNFHAHGSTDAQLKGMISDIQMLYEKRMYAQCEKRISQAKRLAVKYEKYLPLLEILTWQIEVMQASYFIGKEERQIESAHREILGYLDHYRNINDYILLSNKIFLKVSKKGFIRSASEKKELQKLFDKRLSGSSDSYEESFYYYQSKGVYSYLNMDYKNASIHTSKLVALMESRPAITKEKITQYSAVLNNLCIYQIALKKFNDAEETIQKLWAITPKQKLHAHEIRFVIINLELLLYTASGNFETGVKLAERIEKEKELYSVKNLYEKFETQMNYRTAYMYFGAKNYKMTNFFLNKILNRKEIDVRSDIRCFTLIISLIVHYEMGHHDLLEYTIKSDYRYLQKKNRLYKFESLLLEFFKKYLTKSFSKKELTPKFISLKQNIQTVIKDPLENNALNLFDLLSWIDSKIENRSFAEIVKEKAARV